MRATEMRLGTPGESTDGAANLRSNASVDVTDAGNCTASDL